MIEAIVLGCGTSHGVPTIACDCAVCRSEHPKNQRTRSGLLLSGELGNVLVDAPPELRLQLCRERISSVEGVILTHSHADHLMGLDDLRRFNELTRNPMPIWAQSSVLEDVRRIFRYALTPPEEKGGGVPSYELLEVSERIEIAGVPIETFEVLHGRLPVLGLRVGDLAYLTDVSEIPKDVFNRLEGLRTLILDATRIAPHPTHFHFERSLEVAKLIGAETTYLTHLSHDYDYDETSAGLPPSIRLSYDGLRIQVSLV